jgi:methionyl-tRNA formyltransferase
LKIIICNSNNWFSIKDKDSINFEYKFIHNKDELTLDYLESYKPDYIFFVHWNWIVKEDIYGKYESIVFHTAPLPYGRGGSPIQNLILNGIKSSPVCALKMTGDIDAGPIYLKKEISLSGPLSKIFSRINNVVNSLIIEIIDGDIVPVDQEGTPYNFKRLTQKDNQLKPNLSLNAIYDRIRMLDHKDYPNAYIIIEDIKYEFFNAVEEEDFVNVSCKISKC